MLTPLAMKHVRLLMLTEDLPQAALTLAESESFHPDHRVPDIEQLAELADHTYRENYQQAHARLSKIAGLVPIAEDAELTEVRVVAVEELKALNDWLGKIWHEASRYEEEYRRLDDEARFVAEQQAALDNFAELKVDLGLLHTKTRFLDFYVGLVPRENLRQLEGATALAEHLLYPYMVRGEQAHVVIVGPRGEREAQLSSVLASAGFQSLPIPRELERSPEETGRHLAARRDAIGKEREALTGRLADWAAGIAERLAAAEQTLRLVQPLVALDPSIRSAGHLAYLAGWVPARAVDGLETQLREGLTGPLSLEMRDPLPEERRLVPTVPTRNRWLKPFATLVKQYGIPEYGEVDPTPLFAVTFLLMFGMMFGDLGHGAVIAMVAWLARAKLKEFAWFGIAAGGSSMAFGLLFGSVFGYEELAWLPALWMAPLHDPILMLQVALGWGIGFIVLACLLGIYNRLVTGNREGATFGPHGAVNLAFYLGFLAGGYGLATSGSFGWLPGLVVVTSLATLAAYQWRHLEGPIGERALIVFIETLDTVIVYLSNTLSFLRVSAFSLNHAALAIAIFTLADMLGTLGTVITLILGNLFILVLEGGIVMIQVMRLEYYEGFSRYFSGDGHAFAPLRLRRGGAPTSVTRAG